MSEPMIYEVRHNTRLHYAGPVQLARFILRLQPAPWPGQRLLDYQLDITPPPRAIEHRQGPFLANRARLSLGQPISELTIESRFRIEIAPARSVLALAQGPSLAEITQAALASRDLSATGPASYLYPSAIATAEEEIGEWAAPHLAPHRPVVAAARALMGAIHAAFRYDGTATHAATPPIEAFRQRVGVCQDFAHVMIIAARAHGLPAAYISGYLRTRPPEGQPRLLGADAMHAWVGIWCGDALGWVGFDPTNDMLVQTDHIFTAMGRDFADVSPLDGVFHGGAGQTMLVGVDVIPQDELA